MRTSLGTRASRTGTARASARRAFCSAVTVWPASGSNRSRDWSILFFQAEDGIRVLTVTGVQTCALPISILRHSFWAVSLQQPRHYANARRGKPGLAGAYFPVQLRFSYPGGEVAATHESGHQN